MFSLRECKLPTLLIDSTGRPLRKGGCFTKPTSNAFHETTQSMTTCALTSVRTTIYDNAFYSSMILSFAARFHCLLSHLSPVESSRCRIPSCNFISFFREKTVILTKRVDLMPPECCQSYMQSSTSLLYGLEMPDGCIPMLFDENNSMQCKGHREFPYIPCNHANAA